ncbi:RNA polymerase II C-terminal domain phosphatase-like 2 isoform X2 [Rosa chinensis]|uniref:RNA polymerase II C-terminal domain phosphatase-like 2 isoform X2 n=1 Tax=Rosa chinensis TaxID=74649 RepID=UPI001AD8F92B|nr:RNA polymerase II C-terminal domain phosphatase-like 2 isoform X2 [Rosa chinensis]
MEVSPEIAAVRFSVGRFIIPFQFIQEQEKERMPRPDISIEIPMNGIFRSCYIVPANCLYRSGVSLLDNRYLGIVLNLEKIFIEWNNKQSFALKIQGLQSVDGDTHSAEIDRYEMNKPVIRVPNRNIVLTRIDPKDPSTSILVRVRPGWKDFRKYLVGKNSRHFHVFACMESSDDFVTKLWSDVLAPRAYLVEPHLLRYHVFGLTPGIPLFLFFSF